MTSSQLREILKSNILLLSAAEGSDASMQTEQLEAGAHIILAPALSSMDDEEADIIAELLEAAGDRAFVAGQIAAPAEGLAEAGGALSYEACYKQVLSQAIWLDNMGVSMIFLTGCRDIVTAKCAVYAIREAAFDMPVCVGICLPKGAESLQRALSMLIALQPLGICAFGCSHMDIEDSLSVLSELQAFTTVPLFSLADPGRFLTPETYGDYIPSLVHQKCALLGLTGGSPAFTAAASKEIWQLMPLRPDFPVLHAVCSQNEAVFLDFQGKIVSRQKQLIEIKTEKEEELHQILPVINKENTAPVCFHIRDLDLLEYAISHYAGRPAVCSDEYGEITAKELGALIMSESATEKKGETK